MCGLLKIIRAALFVFVFTNAFAQTNNHSSQFEIDQLRFQQMQMQSQMQTMRLQAETERLQNTLNQPNVWDTLAKQAEEIKAAQERAEAKKAAEESAEGLARLQNEINLANVRSTNNMYLFIFISALVGLGYQVRKKMTTKNEFDFHEKFGILVMIGSAIFFIFSLIVSDNWIPQVDFLQNLLMIRISFLEQSTFLSHTTYYVNFPTKYLVMLTILGFAYGLTTYLGITPAWERAKSFFNRESQDTDTLK